VLSSISNQRSEIRNLIVLSSLVLVMAGCGSKQLTNPSFPLTEQEARQAIDQMERSPVKLRRPVVVVGGTFDIGLGVAMVASPLKRVIADDRVTSLSMGFSNTFDGCRQRVIDAVDEAFPSRDPLWTTEVDVIALSMGGLAARYAAAPSRTDRYARRLKIARMFSLSVPHRGASLSDLPSPIPTHIDMKAGSDFLVYLDRPDNRGSYPIFAYTRLNDHIVGSSSTAPQGSGVWWVPTPPLGDAHGGAHGDVRILADVFRRLRGEMPFGTEPPAPLPE
jgi:hypothetical protein